MKGINCFIDRSATYFLFELQ